VEKARNDRQPQLVEAVTYRFRGHSMADPEEYREKEEVEEWQKRDPVKQLSERLVDEDLLSEDDVEKLDEEAIETIDEATQFADDSEHPDVDSLYDEVYVFTGDVPGWWTVDERSPETHPGEQEREAGDVSRDLAEKGAAYAGVGKKKEKKKRDDEEDSGEEEDESQGSAEDDEAEEDSEDEEEASSDGGDPEASSDQEEDDKDQEDSGEDESAEDAEEGEGEESGEERDEEGGGQ